MTDEIKTGGPAFPQSGAISGAGDVWMSSELGGAGLTVRDYMAIKAMQGILSNSGQLDNVNNEAANWVSRDAYMMADAMIKARG